MTTSSVDTRCPQCDHEAGETRFCANCRFPLMQVANKYRLMQKLAEGGFGTVFLAHHIHLVEDKARVVKVMKPEVMQLHGMEQRFFREVRITSSLSQRNEHIVRIYDDFGEEEQLGFYYIMEYLEGKILSHLLHEHGRLSVGATLAIFDQMCRGIGEAHRAEIVHRDLKPENIILIQRHQQPNFVKILDFGIAKPLGDNSQPNLTQGVIGTPAYMSPEQCMGQPLGPQTDIYATGIILYELLTGATPFHIPPSQSEGSGMNTFMVILNAQITKPPPSLRERVPEIPAALDQAILRSLAKKPHERYSSMEEFRQALMPFFEHGAPASVGTGSYANAGVPLSAPTGSPVTPFPMKGPDISSAGTQAFDGRDYKAPSAPKKGEAKSGSSMRAILLFAIVGLLLVSVGLAYKMGLVPGLASSDPKPAPLRRDVVTPDAGAPAPRLTGLAPMPDQIHPQPQTQYPALRPVPQTEPRVRRRRVRRRRLRRRRRRRRRVVRRRVTPRRVAPRLAALRPPVRRRDDMPTAPPPKVALRPNPPQQRDDMPTAPPPSVRRPRPRPRPVGPPKEPVARLIYLGKSLRKDVKARASRARILSQAKAVTELWRKHKGKVPGAKRALARYYTSYAYFRLLIDYRRHFLRQAPIGSTPRSVKQAHKTYLRKRKTYFRRRIDPLFRFRDTPYYLCAFFYTGEGYHRMSMAYRRAAAMPSTKRARMHKKFRREAQIFHRLSLRGFRRGIKVSRRVRNRQACKPRHLQNGLKRALRF